MLSRLRDYFGMSQREARGFLILLIFSVFCLLAPLLSYFLFDDLPTDTAATDQQQLDSLLAKMQTSEAARSDRDNYENRTLADHYVEPAVRNAKRFTFDPNTATVSQLQELGLPDWLAERIGKYRSKGGRFRKKEDLTRIYGFPPGLYQELEPYMVLQGVEQKPGAEAIREDFEPRMERTNHKAGYEEHRAERLQPFDINKADTTQLVRLKGIGSKLATRIIKFRDALGGFVSTEQYADIFGLDSLALNELQRLGRIQSAPRKLNINTASAEDLDRHVYLSRRQAEIIVRYREQHGAFSSLDALRPIRVLDPKTIEKLGPYLEF